MQTTKLTLSIEKREICYLQWIIESYDGMASLRTIDPAHGKVEISIAPECSEEIFSLINRLEEDMRIHVKEKKGHSP
jgi:hypothetical protein